MVNFARWQIILIAVICFFGVAFAAPNLLSRGAAEALPSWLPHEHMNLGLDLQGGSHILLEVEVATVIAEYLDSTVDTVRRELRKRRIGFRGLGVEGHAVVFSLRDIGQRELARRTLRELVNTTLGAGGGGALSASGPDIVLEVGDDGKVRLTLTDQAIKARTDSAVDQSIEVVRRRIDETGTREPTIQRQGADRILVQLPGVDDPERIKRLLGKTAKMTFHLVDQSAIGVPGMRVPPGSRLLPHDSDQGRYVLIRKRVMVSGEHLIDSQPTFDQGRPVVSFRFDSIGARRFGNVTKRNVGKPFAIVLDGRVISAPVIREPILGGAGIITGGFTVQSAQDLSLLLRAGALPAPLQVIEERTVGPGLGADSIAAGKIASVLGMIFVVIFMVVAYGRFGVMADVALVLNLILIAGALSLLQATLTLPGIAGIVLTIGMAVDANVLVFERIREEVRAGRTPLSAVDAGYRRALTTIIDSNLTTFFAALLLFMFGAGPIKGFAVTLSIGLATSMFTATMVTRLLLVTWLRRTRPQVLKI